MMTTKLRHYIMHVHSPRSSVHIRIIRKRGQISSAKIQGGNPIWMTVYFIRGRNPPPPSENELCINNLKGICRLFVSLQIGSVPNESNTLIRHCRERGKKILINFD